MDQGALKGGGGGSAACRDMIRWKIKGKRPTAKGPGISVIEDRTTLLVCGRKDVK